MHGAKYMKESGLVKELVWISWKREKYLDPARNPSKNPRSSSPKYNHHINYAIVRQLMCDLVLV
jgi:hypothetical protein